MSLLKYFTAISMLLIATNSFAQYQISGQITDAENQMPLPGVSIYLPDLKKGSITDFEGNYQLPSLKKGTYLIKISSIGYQSIAQKIELNRDTILDFKMDLSATELDEIIVTGVSRSTELKRNPVIVKTMDQRSFHQNSSTNLIDALKNVPGISEITTGPNVSKPVIRGLGFNRLISLNNGIKQEGQQWGDEHGIEIDEHSIDRVEIIKGPGSLMYGSDGIAGVLNFLPPKPPLNGSVKTRLLSNYQSNNQLWANSISNAGNKNGWQWQTNLSRKSAKNYTNKYDGKVLNSGFEELNGKLSLGINKNWGHSFLTLNSYNSKLGIVEGERDEFDNFTYINSQGEEVTASDQDLKNYTIGVPYQRVNHLSLSTNNYFLLNKGSINLDLGYQHNLRREYEEAETPDKVGLQLSLTSLNYNFRYNFEKTNEWETSIGLGGMWQNNKNKGNEFLIPDYQLFDIGAFVYTQKTFDRLTLAGGLRIDNRKLHTEDLFLNAEEEPVSPNDEEAELKFAHFSRNYQGFSGSLGLSYQLSSNSTLKFNLSRGFRAPNIAELASNGKHEGTFSYEIGNSTLKSENSHQIDLAYSVKSEHLTFEISPFLNFIDHYIYLEKLQDEEGNEVIIDSDDPVPAYRYTSGKAKLIGGEIYLDWHPHPLDWLHIENSFAYVQVTQSHKNKDQKYLPFIPAPHYRGGLKAEFGEIGKNLSQVYLQFNLDYHFAQNKVYRAYDTETNTPGYGLLSAGIGSNIKLFNKKDFLSIYFSGNNLTNKAYQNHLNRLKYADENSQTGRTGVFDMGRNFSLKAIINI